ncbi:head GIN domain-containing protein [Spongiimicrobium salis]|uniref:head GIN domain-containing protein n=1 Tax=Spongiimicrobium salis TaxID=1667022 RepID=UPI00374D64A6
MTTLVKITVTLLMGLLLSSCVFEMDLGKGKRGNGKIVEDQREVSEDFTSVLATEGIDVFIMQGADFNIEVEADENIIDLIGTDIKDGRLKVHAIENIGRATKKVYVTLPEITALSSSSGADLIAKNKIETDKIRLSASSGSDLKVEISAEEIEADASSGADIRISGDTNTLYADASSGSDIRARDLLAKTCRAGASSGADIRVNVSESLIANASSGADISYTGNASVQKKKSVSGSVRKY